MTIISCYSSIILTQKLKYIALFKSYKQSLINELDSTLAKLILIIAFMASSKLYLISIINIFLINHLISY